MRPNELIFFLCFMAGWMFAITAFLRTMTFVEGAWGSLALLMFMVGAWVLYRHRETKR